MFEHLLCKEGALMFLIKLMFDLAFDCLRYKKGALMLTDCFDDTDIG